MSNITLDSITMEELNKRIDELRDSLNEICCTDINTQVEEERLITSRNLDELIVKYMMGIKRKVPPKKKVPSTWQVASETLVANDKNK